MAYVRGNDSWTSLRIAMQTAAWSTEATGSGTEVYYAVPIRGESLVLNRDFFPGAREFGGTGAREYVEAGRSYVSGSFSVHGRYDAKWFNILLAYAFGKETLVQDKFVDGTAITPADAGNAHVFDFSTSIPYGLTIDIHKGGNLPNGTTYHRDTLIGCLITSFSVEQNDNEPPIWTFSFLGRSVNTQSTTANSGSPLATPGGVQYVKIRDASRSGSLFKIGNTLTSFNWRRWSISVDRHLEFDPAFTNTPDTIDQPGVSDVREVKGELVSYVTHDRNTTNKPWPEFRAGTSSKLQLILASATAVGNKTYGYSMEIPLLYWEAADESIKEGGANDGTYRLVAVKGTFTGITGGSADGDLRAMTTVLRTDEPSLDSKFSVL